VLGAAASSPAWCRCHRCQARAVILLQLELLEPTGLIFLLTLDSCSYPPAAFAVVLVCVVMQVQGVVQCVCLGQRTDPDQIQLASPNLAPTKKCNCWGLVEGRTRNGLSQPCPSTTWLEKELEAVGTQYFVLQCHKKFLLSGQVVTLFSSL